MFSQRSNSLWLKQLRLQIIPWNKAAVTIVSHIQYTWIKPWHVRKHEPKPGRYVDWSGRCVPHCHIAVPNAHTSIATILITSKTRNAYNVGDGVRIEIILPKGDCLRPFFIIPAQEDKSRRGICHTPCPRCPCPANCPRIFIPRRGACILHPPLPIHRVPSLNPHAKNPNTQKPTSKFSSETWKARSIAWTHKPPPRYANQPMSIVQEATTGKHARGASSWVSFFPLPPTSAPNPQSGCILWFRLVSGPRLQDSRRGRNRALGACVSNMREYIPCWATALLWQSSSVTSLGYFPFVTGRDFLLWKFFDSTSNKAPKNVYILMCIYTKILTCTRWKIKHHRISGKRKEKCK